MAQLKLFLFGPPRCECDGQVRWIRPRKALALLAYLAVTRQPHSRDVLTTLFWPDKDQRRGRANLRNTLYRLRQALGDSVLVATTDTIALKLRPDFYLDVEAFQRHLTAGRKDSPLSDLPSGHTAALVEAAKVYADDFMAGFTLPACPAYNEWQFFQREGLRQSVAKVLEHLTNAYQSQREFEQAISQARRWLSLDPLHEPAHRALMQLYSQSGRQTGAVRQYEDCVRVLNAELGVPPEEATTTLFEEIKARRAVTPLFPVETREPETLVKSKGQTGRVPEQAQNRTGKSDLPLASKLPRHNLPPQTTAFVGREQELTKIQQLLLEDPHCRLLTLVGIGGIGKTRLAIESARILLYAHPEHRRFSDGLLFVPLQLVSSANGVISAVAEAIGFQFYDNVPPEQQLLYYLQNKRILLVLDNFEHLVSSASLLSDILRTAPSVKMLVSSREALNLQEEWLQIVPGLSFPGGEAETGTRKTNYDAVHLFEHLSQRANVGFSANRHRAEVHRICRLVEGMPLALELAASWLKVLPVEGVVKELERGLDILTTRNQNVPDRHRSIRTAMEQSWRLLSDEERNILKRLSVFRGGFRQAAAKEVATAPLLSLTTLVEKALLRVSAQGRYELHELLCQFAGEKLTEVTHIEVETQNRHSIYYLRFLGAREAALSSKEESTALDEIEAEIGNIRVGWVRAVELGKLEAIGQAVDSFYNFYQIRGRYQEGQEYFAYAFTQLQEAEGINPSPSLERLLSKLAARLGTFCYELCDYEAAKEHLQASLKTNDQSDRAFALKWLGNLVSDSGADRYLGEAHLYQSLTIYRDIGYLKGVADVQGVLSVVATSFGDYAQGQQLAKESLTISRQLEWPDLVAHALNALSWPTICLGAYEEAEAYIRECLAICQKTGNLRRAAWCLNLLGWMNWCLGGAGLAAAKTYQQESLAMYRKIGNKSGISMGLADLALTANAMAEHTQAQQFGRESVTLARTLDIKDRLSHSLLCLGAAMIGNGDFRVSKRTLLEAVEVGWAARIPDHTTIALFYYAVLLCKEGELADLSETVKLQKKAQALELLVLAQHHPATWAVFKDRAAHLRAELEVMLPAEVAARATAQAQSRTLDEVVPEVLQAE